MRFLIKAAFWLTIVVLLLPADSARQGDAQRAQVGPVEALGVAQAAITDATDFCSRKPDACEMGSQAFQTFGEKAQHGAKLLYEFLSAQFAGRGTARGTTGSIKTERKPGRHTLSPDDLEPEWGAPAPKAVPMPLRPPV